MAKLTATNSSAFQMLQPNTGTFAMTNLFNASAAGNPNSVEICLDIPLSNEANPCSSTIDGQCSVAYTGQGASTNPGGVLACPALAVLGSVSGRNETWGVQCGAYNNGNNILAGLRDYGSNVSPVYDLNLAAAATGYPVIAANTPSTVVCIDSVECGASGNHNHFLDAYLFDTTQNPPLPQYSNTINGINGRSNKTWNIAFFIRHPNLSNIQSFTGGQVIVPNVSIGGFPHQILLKYETGGGNSFPQVIFVWTTPDPTPRTIRKFDFKNYSDYLLSNAFWNAIQSSAFAQGVIQAMANPTNGAPPVNAIRPNGSMYWDGFKLGNEVWGTQQAGTEAKICYDELSIQVEGREMFGKQDITPEPEPDTLTCLNPPPVSSPGAIPASSLVSGGTAPYTVSNVTGAAGITSNSSGTALVVASGLVGNFTGITYTITDANGVSTICTQTVPVLNNVDPLQCAEGSLIDVKPDQKIMASYFVDGGNPPYLITDFSSTGGAIQCDEQSVYFELCGEYTLTLTVTDGDGNSVECTRNVKVCRCASSFLAWPMR